jgi:large conductance mechanosensitive channel
MNFIQEFKSFIQRGNAMDLAVGIIMGAAFTAIVTSLVTDVFTPLLGIATQGNDSFSWLDITLPNEAKIKVGSFVKAIINFFIISFCVFLLVKGINAIHLQKLLDVHPKPAELTTEEKLLTEIRDLLKDKQGPVQSV